jgi:hypothetical protein
VLAVKRGAARGDGMMYQAAWAAFQKWQRIDYSANPKYDIVP